MGTAYRGVLVCVAAILMFFLAGCGGGGSAGSGAGASPPGGSSGTSSDAGISLRTVTGVAATGAPAVGPMYLLDSSDPPVQLMTATANDGSFTFHTEGRTPPYLLKIATGGKNLYSLAKDDGLTNVTPLTTMVVSQAAAGANLDTLFQNRNPADIKAAAAKLPDAVKSVQKVLAPLLTSYNVSADAIMNGRFSANHTGMDALLDAVSVSIATGSVTMTTKGGATLFTAPATDLSQGSIVVANLPTGGGTTATPGTTGSSSGGSGTSSGSSTGSGSSSTTTPPDGAALYGSTCAGCHGPLASSTKSGITLAKLQEAITKNKGGMGAFSSLTVDTLQAIVTALAPASGGSTSGGTASGGTGTSPGTPPDGTALYTANCSGCHGPLATSSKTGINLATLQDAIAKNKGGMGAFASLNTDQLQAIVQALTPATTGSGTSGTGGGSSTTTDPSTSTPDGAALYASDCAGCHGPLATSAKIGVSMARLQAAIANNTGGAMGAFANLGTAILQAIVQALTPATPPPSSSTPDGAVLYTANCAGCHGPLATSAKGGATVALIQAGIAGNYGGMGAFSTLTDAQLTAIAATLATVTPPTSVTPSTCGSCHAIPPATGHHAKHIKKGLVCSQCHGTGYSTTTVNTATHNNGGKEVIAATGWDAVTRSCTNSCHTLKYW